MDKDKLLSELTREYKKAKTRQKPNAKEDSGYMRGLLKAIEIVDSMPKSTKPMSQINNYYNKATDKIVVKHHNGFHTVIRYLDDIGEAIQHYDDLVRNVDNRAVELSIEMRKILKAFNR